MIKHGHVRPVPNASKDYVVLCGGVERCMGCKEEQLLNAALIVALEAKDVLDSIPATKETSALRGAVHGFTVAENKFPQWRHYI